VASNNDNTFVMLNNSKICLLAFTTSSLQPRVRAETCSVTTAPSPELSIIGTSFKSNTIRTFLFRVGQEHTIIGKKTGQQRKISLEAELFFVPARFWPVVLMALGLVCFFYNAHRSA
jgi:hypothetical protein